MVVQDHAQKVDVGVADRLWVEEVVREDLDSVADRRRLRIGEVGAIGNDFWHVLCDEPEAREGFCERDADAAWGATDLGGVDGLVMACTDVYMECFLT